MICSTDVYDVSIKFFIGQLEVYDVLLGPLEMYNNYYR
jgi:hypothetical protein